MAPGTTTNLMIERVADLDRSREITKQIPFEISCIDIQQRLIRKDGPLTAQNTIDWITRFTITDETGVHNAVVQMNRPFDYRGYRFFQSSFTPLGRARSITINVEAVNGGGSQTVAIDRDGSAELADGTAITFSEFRGNFRAADEDTSENTTDYKNPAAVLQVTARDGASETAYAVGPQMAKAPFAGKPVAGYIFHLADFEKVADQHVLSVQRDPGASVVYVGFVLLFVALTAVFAFSHQRVWAALSQVDSNNTDVVLGGHANRNMNAFGERFDKFVDGLRTK
jgi:cytochrome c biogenesis protein